MKQRFSFFFKLLFAGSLTLVAIQYAHAVGEKKESDKVFYRYKNEQGVNVVAQSIPPQYVRNGYEIVSVSGDVLKTVAPTPLADAERIAQERKAARDQARADIQLRRNYSSITDIDSAKTRALLELRNNITILHANLSSVKAQLKDQEAHAATLERDGKPVSDDIMKNITTLRTEEKDVTAQIQQREIEYQAAADKFEQDKKRFLEITKPKS